MVVEPVFVTVEAPSTAKLAAEPSTDTGPAIASAGPPTTHASAGTSLLKQERRNRFANIVCSRPTRMETDYGSLCAAHHNLSLVIYTALRLSKIACFHPP